MTALFTSEMELIFNIWGELNFKSNKLSVFNILENECVHTLQTRLDSINLTHRCIYSLCWTSNLPKIVWFLANKLCILVGAILSVFPVVHGVVKNIFFCRLTIFMTVKQFASGKLLYCHVKSQLLSYQNMAGCEDFRNVPKFWIVYFRISRKTPECLPLLSCWAASLFLIRAQTIETYFLISVQ